MAHAHSVPTCRWGQPTLQLQRPYWFEAAGYDWSCTRESLPRLLPDPSVCQTCAAWVPVEDQASQAPGRQ